MKTCKDIITQFSLPDQCCDSCHEDYEIYNYDLITLYDDLDKPFAYVCCVVSNNYSDRI